MPRKKESAFLAAIDAEIIARGRAADDAEARELLNAGRAVLHNHNHRILTSSESPDWQTPDWLYNALDQEFQFVLDAAANGENHKAPHWLGPDSPICEDGLVLPWQDAVVHLLNLQATALSSLAVLQRVAVFVNHPYSRKLGMAHEPWLRQMALAGEHMTVVGVVPYSPQTKWWRKYVVGVDYRATEIRLFPYRIAFDPPPGYDGDAPGANVNTAIVVWKPSELFVDPWVPQLRYWNPRPDLRFTGGPSVVDDGE